MSRTQACELRHVKSQNSARPCAARLGASQDHQMNPTERPPQNRVAGGDGHEVHDGHERGRKCVHSRGAGGHPLVHTLGWRPGQTRPSNNQRTYGGYSIPPEWWPLPLASGGLLSGPSPSFAARGSCPRDGVARPALPVTHLCCAVYELGRPPLIRRLRVET